MRLFVLGARVHGNICITFLRIRFHNFSNILIELNIRVDNRLHNFKTYIIPNTNLKSYKILLSITNQTHNVILLIYW